MTRTEKFLTAGFIMMALFMVGSSYMAYQAFKQAGAKPPAAADQLGEDAKAYTVALSKSCDDAADKVDDGELKTINSVLDAIKAARTPTRTAVSADMDAALKRAADADGNINDRAGASAALRLAAKGFAGK